MNLRLRLSLILSFVLIATVGVGMSYLLLDVRRTITDELQSSIEISSRLIALALQQRPPAERATLAAEIGEQLSRVGNTRHIYIALARGGTVVEGQTESLARDDAPPWFVRLVHPEPLELVRELHLGEGGERIIVRANASDEIAESWREIKPVIAMLVVFVFSANILVYFGLGRSLASLSRIAAGFEAIEAGRYDVKVSRVGVADVDAIAERFNHMSSVLQRSDEQTQTITQRSLVIQEDERRHLAQELHDELGQSISAIKALAVSIRDAHASEPKRISASADTIVDVSSDIYARVRRMMAHLRPVVLDELGLISALQAMVDDWNTHHEESFCSFSHSGPSPKLDDRIAINCYRVVQEALTNVAKHANSNAVSIEVHNEIDATGGSELRISIVDDGCGFDIATTNRGLGLVGIHERIEAIGGSLVLSSALNSGTQYLMVIPHTIREDK